MYKVDKYFWAFDAYQEIYNTNLTIQKILWNNTILYSNILSSDQKWEEGCEIYLHEIFSLI